MITTKQLEELGFKRYAHSKNGVKCYYYALFTYDFPELNNIQLRTKSIEDETNAIFSKLPLNEPVNWLCVKNLILEFVLSVLCGISSVSLFAIFSIKSFM